MLLYFDMKLKITFEFVPFDYFVIFGITEQKTCYLIATYSLNLSSLKKSTS